MVAEALVIAADQCGVDGPFHTVWPILGEQDAEQMATERVDFVVRYGQPAAGQRVLVLDCSRGVLGELAGEQGRKDGFASAAVSMGAWGHSIGG